MRALVFIAFLNLVAPADRHAFALAAPPAAPAATPKAPEKGPEKAPDNLVSPQVHADRRVTFRLWAPKAQAVELAGEWTRAGAPPNAPQKMERDPAGLWSLTVGPLEPNIYIYVFQVDGMTIVDPINPFVKLRVRTSASMVEVPGGEPWEFRDVPHGTLTTHTHASRVLGGVERQVVIYTPPGYDPRRGARYPVTYLLHGNNDLAVGWTMAGRANFVLDAFLAEKKARPMIVVMPWGHALPFGTRPPPGQPDNNDLFERYLLEEVVPLVEKNHRIAPGRGNRAIVGLSMGGTQALQIGLGHPDRFGTVGIFGAGLEREAFDARYAEILAKRPKRFAKDLFFVGVAVEDRVLARAKSLAEALASHALNVTYHETSGGHTYAVWRKLLVETVPLLFPRTSRSPAPRE